MSLEIGQVVFRNELAGVLQAGRADVDAYDVRLRPAERVLRSLPRTATGDENVQIAAERLLRPEEMVLGAGAIRVAPLVSRAIEILDRRWIGMSRVELTHGIARVRCFWVPHGSCSIVRHAVSGKKERPSLERPPLLCATRLSTGAGSP